MKAEAHPKSFPKGRTFNSSYLKFRVRVMLLLFSLPLGGMGWAQSTTIKKSDKIETVDGKKFYIHTVEKGQTLYSIAKTYSTTVDIILSNNPDAVDGLKTGDKLKIPFLGETKKEIKEVVAIKEIKEQKPDSNLVNIINKKEIRDTISSVPVKQIGDIHVALFLPLSLAMIDAIDVGNIARGDSKLPDDSKNGIEFYEGMKLALDSLEKGGFKGKIHVYDYNLDSAGFAKLMKKPELKEMDLIIGPLSGKKFEAVLKFAKENKINMVAPTLQGNNILMGNMNVSKVTPSYATQAEAIGKYAAEKFAGQNIILFNSANPKDKPYINTFRKTANALLSKSTSDSVKEVTFATLKNFISKTKPNIIVIPSTNQSFVTEAVNKLYLTKQETKDSIIVFGMSNWMDYESLDFGYLNTLHATVSSYQFIDYNNPQTKKFILRYRSQYKSEPSSTVFSGFDVGYFYLSGLQKYGNDLQMKLPELKLKGFQTEFNFFQPDSGSGYENKGVGIMQFENYTYIRVR